VVTLDRRSVADLQPGRPRSPPVGAQCTADHVPSTMKLTVSGVQTVTLAVRRFAAMPNVRGEGGHVTCVDGSVRDRTDPIQEVKWRFCTSRTKK
jgi:hypothetical protein